jgi:hypothetical protein
MTLFPTCHVILMAQCCCAHTNKKGTACPTLRVEWIVIAGDRGRTEARPYKGRYWYSKQKGYSLNILKINNLGRRGTEGKGEKRGLLVQIRCNSLSHIRLELNGKVLCRPFHSTLAFGQLNLPAPPQQSHFGRTFHWFLYRAAKSRSTTGKRLSPRRTRPLALRRAIARFQLA